MGIDKSLVYISDDIGCRDEKEAVGRGDDNGHDSGHKGTSHSHRNTFMGDKENDFSCLFGLKTFKIAAADNG